MNTIPTYQPTYNKFVLNAIPVLKEPGSLFCRFIEDQDHVGLFIALHEMSHMISFWINDKSHRLLLPRYGFKLTPMPVEVARHAAIAECEVFGIQLHLTETFDSATAAWHQNDPKQYAYMVNSITKDVVPYNKNAQEEYLDIILQHKSRFTTEYLLEQFKQVQQFYVNHLQNAK